LCGGCLDNFATQKKLLLSQYSICFEYSGIVALHQRRDTLATTRPRNALTRRGGLAGKPNSRMLAPQPGWKP
jgi:hypothetical protein